MEYFKQWVIYTREETDGLLLWETSAVVVPKYGPGMHSWKPVQQLLQNGAGFWGVAWKVRSGGLALILFSFQPKSLTLLKHAFYMRGHEIN